MHKRTTYKRICCNAQTSHLDVVEKPREHDHVAMHRHLHLLVVDVREVVAKISNIMKTTNNQITTIYQPTAHHTKSYQITANHSKSQQLSANHSKSQHITASPRQISANHSKSQQITANHSKSRSRSRRIGLEEWGLEESGRGSLKSLKFSSWW